MSTDKNFNPNAATMSKDDIRKKIDTIKSACAISSKGSKSKSKARANYYEVIENVSKAKVVYKNMVKADKAKLLKRFLK